MDNPNSSFKETPNWLSSDHLPSDVILVKQGRSSSENSGGREVSIQLAFWRRRFFFCSWQNLGGGGGGAIVPLSPLVLMALVSVWFT